MKNLTERLDKHLQSIREDSGNSSVEIVKSLVGNYYPDDKLVRALADCCKTNKFIPSTVLDKALVDTVAQEADTLLSQTSNTDGEKALENEIKNLCKPETYKKYIISDTIGEDFIEEFESEVSPEFLKAWKKGLLYCINSREKICKKALIKVKSWGK